MRRIRLTIVRFAGWRSSIITTMGWCHKTGGSTFTRNLPFGSGPSLIVPHRKLYSGLACGQTVLRRSVPCRTDRSKLNLQARPSISTRSPAASCTILSGKSTVKPNHTSETSVHTSESYILVGPRDMVRHCKWIAYGSDGLGGKGCTRMRPKLHLPVFWHCFPSPSHWCLGIVRHVGGLCCIRVTSIYSRVARFKPVDSDTLEVAQAALWLSWS